MRGLLSNVLTTSILALTLLSCGKNDPREETRGTQGFAEADAGTEGAYSITQEQGKVCSKDELLERADAFLKAVQTSRDANAIVFYEDISGEDMYRLAFDNDDQGFRFRPDVEYSTIWISEYREANGPVGELVAYVETNSAAAVADVSFLEAEIGRKYFACAWICSDGLWKISGTHSCFEETDGPFGGNYD